MSGPYRRLVERIRSGKILSFDGQIVDTLVSSLATKLVDDDARRADMLDTIVSFLVSSATNSDCEHKRNVDRRSRGGAL